MRTQIGTREVEFEVSIGLTRSPALSGVKVPAGSRLVRHQFAGHRGCVELVLEVPVWSPGIEATDEFFYPRFE